MEIGPSCYRSRQEEMVLWNVSICNSLPPKPALRVTDRDKPKPSCRKSQSVTSRRQNRFLLLQIEMFEAVSLQAELGRLVAALKIGGVEPHHAKVRAALVFRMTRRGRMHVRRLSLRQTCTSASKDVKFRHVWGLTYTFDGKTLMAGVRYAIVSKRAGNTAGRRCS